ncbi:hypothetical protein ACFX2J_010001 [Malus domestica]
MDRIGFLAVFFIVFVVADVSDAAAALSKHRILIGEPQNDNTTVPGKEGSPVPSPLLPPTVSSSGGNGSDTKPVDDPSKEKVESSQPAKTPKPKVDQGPKVGLNNDTKKGEGKDVETEKKHPEPAKTSNDDPKPDTDKVKYNPKEDTDKVLKDNPKEKEKDNPKEKEKEKEKDNPKEKEKDNPKEKEKEKDNPREKEKEKQESCAGVTKIKTCAVKDVAVACIKNFSSGSKEVAILVQNVGNSTLNATLSANGASKVLEILKHLNRKVNISIDPGKSTNITLNTGTGECKLHIDPPPPAFPSLKTIATPINGAYFLIVAVLTFGGTWACCLIRKGKERTGGGVPYQELEMGLPESVPATAVETAEGWDEGWDDDWDGENAVKTPGDRLGSISVNGLTSRAANKDGWND